MKFLKAVSLLFAHLFFWAYSLLAVPVAFKEGIFLKDAEVEEILHSLADPLLKAAGLSPQKVRIFLVSTPLVKQHRHWGHHFCEYGAYFGVCGGRGSHCRSCT